MRNLEHSKRVSEANNSCGLCKSCSSKKICKEIRRRSERITESLRTLPFSSVSENSVAALPLSALLRTTGVAAYSAVGFSCWIYKASY